jgi:toxin FitB
VIVLDTNVISSLMRERTDHAVAAWLDAQPSDSIVTTAVTIFEVRTGIELLASSRRRERLESVFLMVLARDLQGRVLPFDEAAAMEAGRLAARRTREGRPVEVRDTQIAGIALVRRATLATRNVRHFHDLQVRIVNPWEGSTR